MNRTLLILTCLCLVSCSLPPPVPRDGAWRVGRAEQPPHTPSPVAMEGSEQPRDVLFPHDSSVVNVRLPPYLAKGDGVTDDTRAIQKALADHANQDSIIFLPAGTYLISDTLRWGPGTHGGEAQKRTILQGQGAHQTLLQLADNSPGFRDLERQPNGDGKSKAMVWTGERPAQRFRNGIRDLTVDIGLGNPAATGIQYIANNQGSLRNVVVRSRAGGFVGLDLGYTDEQGPCLIKNVEVIGFATGVRTRFAVDSVTLQQIRVLNQSEVGFLNDGQSISMESFSSTNSVPAIKNISRSSLLVLVGAELNGLGSQASGIENSGYALLRDVQSTGYAATLKDQGNGTKLRGNVQEWLSHPADRLFTDSPRETLRLPIRQTPLRPDIPLSEWASPLDFGAIADDNKDDTEALQRAVDSGKRVVYLPGNGLTLGGTLHIRGNVEVFDGLEALLLGTGTLSFEPAAGRTQFFERTDVRYEKINIVHAGQGELVMSSVTSDGGTFDYRGRGALFLEDVVTGDLRIPKGRQVWARQLNIESHGSTRLRNDGGSVWVLGYKVEQHGIVAETLNGGTTEILGGLVYSQGQPKDTPMFVIDNAAFSASIAEVSWNFQRQGYHTLARETRGPVTRELAGGARAGRLWHSNDASMVLLYSAYSR